MHTKTKNTKLFLVPEQHIFIAHLIQKCNTFYTKNVFRCKKCQTRFIFYSEGISDQIFLALYLNIYTPSLNMLLVKQIA